MHYYHYLIYIKKILIFQNGIQQSVLKQTSNGTRSSTRLTIKLEPGNNSVNGSGFSLPPTPPSSTNSDSENGSSNVQNSPTSPPHPRPGRPPGSGSSARVYLGGQGSHNRQPIQTPLISSQPVNHFVNVFLSYTINDHSCLYLFIQNLFLENGSKDPNTLQLEGTFC